MVFVFLDIDIADNRSSYKRTAQFVEASSIKYGLSSNDLNTLGGRERLSLSDLYNNDFVWKEKGPCLSDPQRCCRMIFELFTDDSPLACENFLTLCTGSKGKSKSSGLELSYKNSKIHRYVPNFILQGGDFVFGNGTGGESIYGKKFKDDVKGLKLKHDRRGLLSSGNSGKNSNSFQFFITLASAPVCDKKHVVFGKMIHGFEVLDLIEQSIRDAEIAGKTNGGEEVPPIDIVITHCGEWTDTDFVQGYWAEDDTFKPCISRADDDA